MNLPLSELSQSLDRLSEGDRSFANSLLHAHARYGRLTEKQAPWVQKLLDRATKPVETKTEAVGDLAGVMQLFEKARKHLKRPAVVLGCDNGEVRINVAGERARCPGTLNVIDEASRTWFGRIHHDGRFEHSRRDEPPAAVSALLTRFAADPASVASEHGRLTGRCCFCNTSLTDERSTAVGYGPVCAKHYDLPWGTTH